MRKVTTLLWLFLIGILAPNLLNAQATLSGTIKGKGTVLAGASVGAKPSGKGGFSGEDGK